MYLSTYTFLLEVSEKKESARNDEGYGNLRSLTIPGDKSEEEEIEDLFSDEYESVSL